MPQGPWLDDPLGFLIGPERIPDFFARVYEREALVVPNPDGKRFEGLISIDAIDRLITSTDLKQGQIDLADAARQMRRSDYVDPAGFIDRGAVADLHRGGSTIIMQQTHQLEPSLGRFCRALEHIFSAHVQTNLYLTPPNGQGFNTHYDNHCVFVLQIAGEKSWRLYERPVDMPYRGESYSSKEHPAGELKQQFVLKAGDCAYVPRGLMHDASTSGDEPSLHITVGLITRSWAELVLEAVSEAALRTPELRRSLPAGYARMDFDRQDARTHLKGLIELLARQVQLDPALDLITDAFIRSRGADNRGAVSGASQPIGETDRFQVKKTAPFRIADDGDKVVVIGPGGELGFPAADRPALERALRDPAFTPADLGDKGASIATRLFVYGLTERV